MKLETKPITDYNAVINTLQFLRGEYLSQQTFDTICEWIRFHKKCGIYIYRSAVE